MQIIINLGALIGISMFLALRFGDSLTQTLPITLCSIGMVLYILAFFRKLHWITGILALCLLGLALLLVGRVRRDGLRQAVKTAFQPLRETQVWINLAVLAVIILLVNYRRVLEWDAYSFWGADIKSLFYRNGFAERYSNVAPDFGDYPPNTQLMIWWFLHMFESCDEGLMFGGYFFFSGLLLFSATSRLHLKRVPHQVIAGFCAVLLLFALPSVADTSWYRALYADPVMAILWGCLLCTIVLDRTCTEGFRYYKCLVLLMALTLTKSVGFLWAAYGVVLYLLWNGKKHLRYACGMAGAVAAGYIPWILYCRLFGRATYLTDRLAPTLRSQAQAILDGTFLRSGYNLAYIKTYSKAFLFESVHRTGTRGIDLTPALVLLLVLLLFLVFRLLAWLPKGRFSRLFGFIVGVYALTYFILLCSHLTIFYSETQYLERANMLTQMTRYGAPMNLGFLILGISICMERVRLPERLSDVRRGEVLLPGLAALGILLCAGYSTLADCLIKGHDPLDPKRLEQRALFAETYADFLEEASQVPVTGEKQRILLLYSAADYSPIVSFLASPVSIQSLRYDESLTEDTLWTTADQLGASWIYVQDGTQEGLDQLDRILMGCQPNTLYALSQWRAPNS